RELGIVFKDLEVNVQGACVALQPTIGSALNPVRVVEGINRARHPQHRAILSGFEGVVAPGEMLLVLGRPGSGCTTFLKTLANHRERSLRVNGEVCYDSLTSREVEENFRGDVMFCPEEDIHFPTLSVQQTLNFAARTCTSRSHAQDQHIHEVTDTLMRVLGLSHARHTLVGNESVRGISGGERKRVSIAEVLACNPKIAVWDRPVFLANPTRGLDSSTASDLIRIFRTLTDMSRMTTIAAIYQAGEQLYDLFDKVCVIAEGKMVYYGPVKAARQYFVDMGYEPHNRQTTADFLVAVTDPHARKIRDGYEEVVPRTAEAMAAYFRTSHLGKLNRDFVQEYISKNVNNSEHKASYQHSVAQERSKHALGGRGHTISIAMQLMALLQRRIQILRGDSTAQLAQIVTRLFQSFILGTVFMKLPVTTAGLFPRGGILFFSLFTGALAAKAEIPALYSQRPIVIRHRKAAMYYPFLESFAYTLADIPVTILTQLLFCVIVYFLVGLQHTAKQFFTFFLFVFTSVMTMKSLFRTIAACFKTRPAAISLAGIVILLMSLYAGYTVPRPTLPGGLRWIGDINPIRYGFEALLVNEFHTMNATCSNLVPQGPGYENVSLANQVCVAVGSQPGSLTVDGNRFTELMYNYSYGHLWRDYAIGCGFATGLFALFLVMTTLNTALAVKTEIVSFKPSDSAVLHGVTRANDEEKANSAFSHPLPSRVMGDFTGGLESSEKDTEIKVFSWSHVQYDVLIAGGEHRRLLDDVSGFVAPGKLTALMGESGAGKTTLLNVLSQRSGAGVVRGDLLLGGQPLPEDFRGQTGYCQQMDIHAPESTVREALLFSAKLRQPEHVSISEKEAHVDQCLKMCGLEDYADAIVGTLCMEHRKRTTIAVELVAKPKLLIFLDEPTTGLDSQSAWAIIMVLRRLALSGQAILCTIHQPSAELFQLFDALLLLQKGGQTVYFGDVGENSRTMLEYFERGGAPPCAPDANPAEYALDVIGAGATSHATTDWFDIWKKSPESAELQSYVDHIHGCSNSPTHSNKRAEYQTSWFHQVKTLVERGFTSYMRSPTYILAKLVLNLVGGLCNGFTFFQMNDSLLGTQNKLFAIFIATFLCVPLVNQLMGTFIDVRTIYELRERPSRMYKWTALIASQLIVELPWNILGSSLFFFPWFWIVGFPSTRAAYTFLTYCVIFPLYYTTIGQAVASVAPSPFVASLIFATLFAFVVIFNGVMQPFKQLGWWKWMYHVSPFTYLEEGLLGQAIGTQQVNCSPTELVSLNPPDGLTCSAYMQPFVDAAGGYLTNPNATSSCEYCAYYTTDEYLADNFSIEYIHHWRNLGILVGIIVFNVFATFCLTYLRTVRRGRHS
ncbi:hypothetical protein HYDPIDRAFT_99818, partial [Hydnomerulius pinastri MD-312]